MNHEQLELDLQATVEKTVDKEKRSAEVVSLQQIRAKKIAREMSKVYQAILDSVDHISPTDQKYN